MADAESAERLANYLATAAAVLKEIGNEGLALAVEAVGRELEELGAERGRLLERAVDMSRIFRDQERQIAILERERHALIRSQVRIYRHAIAPGHLRWAWCDSLGFRRYALSEAAAERIALEHLRGKSAGAGKPEPGEPTEDDTHADR